MKAISSRRLRTYDRAVCNASPSDTSDAAVQPAAQAPSRRSLLVASTAFCAAAWSAGTTNTFNAFAASVSGSGATAATSGRSAAAAAAALSAADIADLEKTAFEAYANRDFKEAVELLTQILKAQPSNPRWYEMRAQVLVDGKNFDAAVKDFEKGLRLLEPGQLRLLEYSHWGV